MNTRHGSRRRKQSKDRIIRRRYSPLKGVTRGSGLQARAAAIIPVRPVGDIAIQPELLDVYEKVAV